MDERLVLEKTGLGKKEASVYLALLELGTATGYAVAKKADVKQPTAYVVLENLEQKGLVNRSIYGRKVLFTAESPELLVKNVYKTGELLKRYLPSLLALHNIKKERPQMQLFYGKQGVRQVYDQIFSCEEVYFFGTTRLLAQYYPEWMDQMIEAAGTSKIKVRDLLTKSPTDFSYAERAKNITNYQIRFVPSGLSLPSDSAVFGNSVVFFSFHQDLFAAMITSVDVAQSLRVMYEMAWRVAEIK